MIFAHSALFLYVGRIVTTLVVLCIYTCYHSYSPLTVVSYLFRNLAER